MQEHNHSNMYLLHKLKCYNMNFRASIDDSVYYITLQHCINCCGCIAQNEITHTLKIPKFLSKNIKIWMCSQVI
jgi:hypothetical protein